MQTLDQIQMLVREGESEVLEFKLSTGSRRSAVQTICAMLNARGGRILFGVDNDGTIRGQDVGNNTVEELVQEIRELDPPVTPSVERIHVGNGKQVLLVTVMQGPTRPYSIRGKSYKRVGRSTLEMLRDEYHRMLFERMHGDRRWENEPAEGWSIDDLDRAEITRTVNSAIERGRLTDPETREPNELLRGLGLVRDGVLLRAAAVLFGRDESIRPRLSQCLLRVAKFKGTDRAEFADNRQFHGNAFRLLDLAQRFLQANLPVAGRVVPGLFERKDDPLYPPAALREALANAFCHRDYSIGGGSVAIAIYDDRLEITSSGSLHFGLKAEQLFEPHESLPWNPFIAEVFYQRGIIERWGRGTILIAELTTRAGLPRPEIEEAGGCVVVRFRPSRHIPPTRVYTDLTESQRRLLSLFDVGDPLALREILDSLDDAPDWQVRRDLGVLRNLGLIVPKGHGRGAYWHRIPG